MRNSELTKRQDIDALKRVEEIYQFQTFTSGLELALEFFINGDLGLALWMNR